jgi:hypothetical protein
MDEGHMEQVKSVLEHMHSISRMAVAASLQQFLPYPHHPLSET